MVPELRVQRVAVCPRLTRRPQRQVVAHVGINCVALHAGLRALWPPGAPTRAVILETDRKPVEPG